MWRSGVSPQALKPWIAGIFVVKVSWLLQEEAAGESQCVSLVTVSDGTGSQFSLQTKGVRQIEDRLPFVVHRALEWPVSLEKTLATHWSKGMEEAKDYIERFGRPSENRARSCRFTPIGGNQVMWMLPLGHLPWWPSIIEMPFIRLWVIAMWPSQPGANGSCFHVFAIPNKGRKPGQHWLVGFTNWG